MTLIGDWGRQPAAAAWQTDGRSWSAGRRPPSCISTGGRPRETSPYSSPQPNTLSHQRQQRRGGAGTRPGGRSLRRDASRFETECWIWQLAKDRNGYGQVWTTSGMALAHCVYCEERHGPVPEGTELDHLCRVLACVNPNHLEPVTHAENCRRGRRAKLTPAHVAEISSSSETQRVIARNSGSRKGTYRESGAGDAGRANAI